MHISAWRREQREGDLIIKIELISPLNILVATAKHTACHRTPSCASQATVMQQLWCFGPICIVLAAMTTYTVGSSPSFTGARVLISHCCD